MTRPIPLHYVRTQKTSATAGKDARGIYKSLPDTRH